MLEHLADIVTLCNRMFRQAGDAEDATHEAVLAVLRDLPTYRGEGPVRHWVLKVALNAARHHRRRLGRTARREVPVPDDELHRAAAPAARDPAEAREEAEAVRRAIAELSEGAREAFVLYHFHRLTQVEIGRCLGCSQKTVHERLRRGLEQLSRRLAGNAAFGALIATPAAGAAVLDSVPSALAAAVERTIASHHAGLATAAAGAGGQAGIGTAASAAATGGVLMQGKIVVGAAVLAASCVLGGALLSDTLLASDRDARHAAEVARLQGLVDAGVLRQAGLLDDLDQERRRSAARVSELWTETAALREALAQREEELAALRQGGGEEPETLAGAAAGRTRAERWEEIEASLAGVREMFRKMSEEGADQMALGPQLVAELGRIPPERYAEIMAFDADETNPAIVAEIREVMLQAFTFVRDLGPGRDDFMRRYLERVRDQSYGEDFTDEALRRISFSMPPFIDGYGKIVRPLDPALQADFLELALDRSARGETEARRVDGTWFLGHVDDPRATAELMRVFQQSANPTRLRRVALAGLARRGDPEVLRFLRDAQASERDPEVAAELDQAVARVAERVGEGR